jgi:sigma-E factor negative regulatory protein RseB
MRISLQIVAVLACLSVGTGSLAQTSSPPLSQAESISWLQRIAMSARQLNYAGTFIYQQGDVVENSRIAHLVEGGNETERLETLDGPRREIVRKNDVIFIINPESKQIRVERRRPGRFFPQILPDQLSVVTDHYHVRKGEVERVAEHEAQALILEPKDGMRYGHKFWVDTNSGLLLKAKLLGDRNVVMEQFSFTQVQIGGNIPREWLKPSVTPPAIPEKARDEPPSAESAWEIRVPPAGFRKVVETRRYRDQGNTVAVIHMAGSDFRVHRAWPLGQCAGPDAEGSPAHLHEVRGREPGDRGRRSPCRDRAADCRFARPENQIG